MKIYLIWWPPKCGKTTLSKALSWQRGISYISADTLQNIVLYETSEEEKTVKFPHRELRRKYSNNDDFYGENSSGEVVKNYKHQAYASHKAIRSIVETYIIEKDSIIVEWYQVTPELVGDLKKEFWEKNIVEIFLVKSDKWLFVENVEKSSTPSDWILEKTSHSCTFDKIAEMIILYWEFFQKEAQKYGFRLLNMDEKFEEKMDYLVKSL